VGRFIILLLFIVFANASNVLNISYFSSTNKMDILFSLDTPFKGKIVSLSRNSYKITNINLDRIEHKKFKKLDIVISPLDTNSINLKLNYNKTLNVQASITAKGYGLRIRILGLKTENQKTSTQNINSNNLSQVEKSGSFNYFNYIMVILILVFLILVLLYVKKKTLEKLPTSLKQDNYKVLYQKMIDPKNRILMIELFNKRYLLLLGNNNNILLDNFSENNSKTQEELEDISSQSEFDKMISKELKQETKNKFVQNASNLKENNEF